MLAQKCTFRHNSVGVQLRIYKFAIFAYRLQAANVFSKGPLLKTRGSRSKVQLFLHIHKYFLLKILRN